ncbi:hypothetical protein MKK84_06680 [Methylobacterium sp. E-065]|uniref:hypothetical protein n=1 Tax=Methylobacterium sp. E-065 TaxID=2836583 RepID=UPI001FB96FCB|nr:hypothetical protein [Methylobacterium sp. E-065]MCJ2017112.1 hypothetical protein [Methylobacterium sp. E-065]
MAGGRELPAAAIPTPGPWLVRGTAEADAAPAELMLGVEPATAELAGGWPYFIRRNRPVEPGSCPRHIAVGIQRLADARLIAAAPNLTAVLLRLLISPGLTTRDLDPRTPDAVTAGWDLLIAVAPHLEIGR